MIKNSINQVTPGRGVGVKSVMKTFLLVWAAGLLVASQLQAQSVGPITTATNPPSSTTPPTPASFFSQAETWLTSYNTNSTTFQSNSFQAWMGVGYQSGINLGVNIGAEVQPFSGSAHGFTIGSVSTLSDVVGSIAAQEGDIGWSIIHYDVRLTIGGAVTETFQSTAVAEKGISGGGYVQLEKALSSTTFAGIRVKESFGGGNSAARPFLGLFGGFVF